MSQRNIGLFATGAVHDLEEKYKIDEKTGEITKTNYVALLLLKRGFINLYLTKDQFVKLETGQVISVELPSEAFTTREGLGFSNVKIIENAGNKAPAVKAPEPAKV